MFAGSSLHHYCKTGLRCQHTENSPLSVRLGRHKAYKPWLEPWVHHSVVQWADVNVAPLFIVFCGVGNKCIEVCLVVFCYSGAYRPTEDKPKTTPHFIRPSIPPETPNIACLIASLPEGNGYGLWSFWGYKSPECSEMWIEKLQIGFGFEELFCVRMISVGLVKNHQRGNW